jgi:hypothetical protein
MKTKKIVDGDFIAVMNSCVEGRTGEWDCSTEEGKEGFTAMYEGLQKVAERYNLSLKGVKKCP